MIEQDMWRCGVSPIIHILIQMAVVGYPRDRCEAEFGVGRFAGAIVTKTIDSHRCPEKLKSMQAKPCRMFKL